jgi:hypothetical protein
MQKYYGVQDKLPFLSRPCFDFDLFNCKQKPKVPSLKAIIAKCVISQKINRFFAILFKAVYLGHRVGSSQRDFISG